jgi:hypothetical protein
MSADLRGVSAMSRHRIAGVAAAATLGAVLPAAALHAQTILGGELPCVPLGEHAVVTARVDPPPTEESGIVPRVYFRRLSVEVEDFYWIEMIPEEPGNYWAVLPLAESAELPRKELARAAIADRRAAWWRAKEASEHRDPNGDLDAEVIRERASLGRQEKRDWMAGLDDPEFERWLAGQEYEPTEWYLATVDREGRVLETTEMRVAPVDRECKAALTREQKRESNEVRVGDTAAWQDGELPFHWECADLGPRIDVDGDEDDPVCPAAIVWWPVAGGLGALGVVIVIDDDPPGGPPPEVSPSRP